MAGRARLVDLEGANGPAGLRPPRGHPRFPLLDGVRGLAVILVFLTHVDGYTSSLRGTAGAFLARSLWVVAGFFIISGFLLYRPWVAARVSDLRAPTIRGYLANRAFRILPGYWAALIILSVYPGLPQMNGPIGHDWWAYWGLIQTYSRGWIFGGAGQVWTVCIEVSFYLLLPVWMLAARSVFRRWGFAVSMRAELAVLVAMSLLSLVFRVVVTTPLPNRILLYTLPAWLAWFAIGMALALVSVEVSRRAVPPRWVMLLRNHPGMSWAVAVGLLVWVTEGFAIPRGFALLLPFSRRQVLEEFVLDGGVATFLILPAIFGDDRPGLPRRVLGSHVLQRLGVISFGVYLWHSAIIRELVARGAMHWLPGDRFVSLLIPAAALSLFAGWLSYHVVERPFLLREWTPGAQARAAAELPTATHRQTIAGLEPPYSRILVAAPRGVGGGRYVAVLLTSASFALLAVGATNYFVNPQGAWGPHLFFVDANDGYAARQRLIETAPAAHTLILGDSRAALFNAQALQRITHRSTYDAGVTGGSLGDSLTTFQEYLRRHGSALRGVVLFAGRESFAGRTRRTSETASLQSLFSWSEFKASVHLLLVSAGIDQPVVHYLRDGAARLPFNDAQLRARGRGRRRLIESSLPYFAGVWRTPLPPSGERAFARIVAIANRHGIDPVVVLPPYQPLLIAARGKLFTGMLGALHSALARLRRHLRFVTVDATYPSTIGADPRDYLDGVHPGPANGRLLALFIARKAGRAL